MPFLQTPLDDVVAKSFELGSRGQLNNLQYSISVFHTTNHDDILFQTTGRSTGLFANVDKTLKDSKVQLVAKLIVSIGCFLMAISKQVLKITLVP